MDNRQRRSRRAQSALATIVAWDANEAWVDVACDGDRIAHRGAAARCPTRSKTADLAATAPALGPQASRLLLRTSRSACRSFPADSDKVTSDGALAQAGERSGSVDR